MKRSSLVLAGGVLVLGFFLVGSVLAVRLAVVPTLTRSAVASGDPGSLAVDVAGLPGSVRPLGPGETVTLDLGTVRSLETSGSWRVTLVPGAPGHATLRAPQASSFALRVSGGPDAVLESSAPDLKKVAASGTSAFALEGLKTDRFEVDLSGASSVSGSGTVGYLVLALSGASSVDLDRVQAQTARIEGSGAGAVTVHSAGGTVEGELSGAVNLRVTGTPSSVRVDTSGMAAVTRS
jgi:hypothetical protein